MGSKAADYVSRTNIGAYFHSARESRKLVLVIVAIALLLDNMLLTTVVPIIPEFLYHVRHRYDNFTTTTTRPTWAPTPPSTSPPPVSLQTSPDLDWENITNGEFFTTRTRRTTRTTFRTTTLTAKQKIGYSIPMFAGFIIMFLSTVIFAFGRSYSVLFFARALQGIGSSCSSVSGMGMLADRYTDDKERGNAMGIALGGLALGVLIGPPFGGFMYQFVGKTAPFLILAFLALLDGCLQMLILQPEVIKSDEPAPSLKALVSDPYILVCAGAITAANMGIAMLEPSLPLHMMDKMNSERWELGAAFLPASISYLIGTNLFGPMGHKMGRWKASLVGLVIIAIALILDLKSYQPQVPMATKPAQLIIPMGGLGFAIGMVDSSMMPELGNLVDLRHSSVYGGVYAIGDVAFCVGFAVGPALSGTLVKEFGFQKMLVGVGIICLLYCPLLFMLKDPPSKTDQEKAEQERFVFGDKTKVKYSNYDDEAGKIILVVARQPLEPSYLGYGGAGGGGGGQTYNINSEVR